jgi:hypothetical protein
MEETENVEWVYINFCLRKERLYSCIRFDVNVIQ